MFVYTCFHFSLINEWIETPVNRYGEREKREVENNKAECDMTRKNIDNID